MDNKELDIIPEIPEIPHEIVDAINSHQLVIFIGAGVSTLAGLPTWNRLAQNLINKCQDIGIIDESEKDLLLGRNSDPKKLISIAWELFSEQGEEKTFYQVFKDNLHIDSPKDDGRKIFEFLLKSNALILTTNADLLLDKYFEKSNIFFNKDNIENWTKTGPGLVKIHGSVEDISSLVFTSSQYLRRYSDKQFRNYLQYIFDKDRVVLFVGYGLGEFELLEYMLSPLDQMRAEKENRVFVLNPYFNYELTYKKHMDRYYSSINIKQIAYSKDILGYRQLPVILETWQKDFEYKTLNKEKRLEQIKEILKQDPSDYYTQTLLQLIKQSPECESFLYEKLPEMKKRNLWVEELMSTVLFTPEHLLEEKSDRSIPNRRDGLRFLRAFYPKEIPNDLQGKLKEILNNICQELLSQQEDIPSNLSKIWAVWDLLVKFDTNIWGDDLYQILLSAKEFDFRDFILAADSEGSHFDQWEKSDIVNVFRAIFKHLDKQFTFTASFELEKFLDHKLTSVLKVCADDVFDIASQWINSKNDVSYEFYFVGAFAAWEFESPHTSVNFALHILKQSVSELSKNKIKHFLEESRGSENSIIKKLRIYLIAENFNDFSAEIFQGDNLFDDWDLYGDLYYLIKKNANDITEENVLYLYKCLKETTFGKNNLKKAEYINILRYDFMVLLSEMPPCPTTKNDLIPPEGLEKHYPVYERNKRIKIETSFGLENQKQIDDMMKLDGNGIVAYLPDFASESMSTITMEEYGMALETVLQKRRELLEEGTWYLRLPYGYYSRIAHAIAEDEHLQKWEGSFQVLDNLSKQLEKNPQHYSSLGAIYRAFEKMLHSIDSGPQIRDDIFNTVLRSLKNTEEEFFTQYQDYKTKDVEDIIYNSWYPVGLSCLLNDTARHPNESKANQLKKQIDQAFHYDNPLLKTILAKELHLLYKLDEEWGKGCSDKIFDNVQAASSFTLNNFWPKDVWDLLLERKIIDQIAEGNFVLSNSRRKEYIQSEYAAWGTAIQIKYPEQRRDFIETFIQHSGSAVRTAIFGQILNHLNSIDFRSTAIDLLEYVCKIICKHGIKENDVSNDDFNYLVQSLTQLDSICDECWNCLKTMAEKTILFNDNFLMKMIDNHFKQYENELSEVLKLLYDSLTKYGHRFPAELVMCMLEKNFDNSTCLSIKQKLIEREEFSLIE